MRKTADEINSYQDIEELEALKVQLFKENVRIQAEKTQLEADADELSNERKNLISERKRLSREKKQLTIELGELKEQVEFERRRLKEDEKLMERKQKVLEKAFDTLNSDKEDLKKEWNRLEIEKKRFQHLFEEKQKEVYATGVFFRGVNNQAALRKRYKDLLKIYHPDNICGDQEILLKINEEYEELNNRLEFKKKL